MVVTYLVSEGLHACAFACRLVVIGFQGLKGSILAILTFPRNIVGFEFSEYLLEFFLGGVEFRQDLSSKDLILLTELASFTIVKAVIKILLIVWLCQICLFVPTEFHLIINCEQDVQGLRLSILAHNYQYNFILSKSMDIRKVINASEKEEKGDSLAGVFGVPTS